MISIIFSTDQNGLIGDRGKLPWQLPNDLARFKRITMAHPIIMGRKTYESIGGPLPGRTNIVISRRNIEIRGCAVEHSLTEALGFANRTSNNKEIFVIGGSKIIAEAIPLASRMLVTKVSGIHEGDTYLPKIDYRCWHIVSHQKIPADLNNAFATEFTIFKRFV